MTAAMDITKHIFDQGEERAKILVARLAAEVIEDRKKVLEANYVRPFTEDEAADDIVEKINNDTNYATTEGAD